MVLTALLPSILAALRSVPVVDTANTYREVYPKNLRWRQGDRLCEAQTGRACYEKGVDWLLEALALACDRLGETRVEILGDGPEHARLDLDARARFLGKRVRGAAQEALSRARDQLIQSLRPEPLGLVTAEALMRRTPAIVSNQGTAPKIVEHCRTGWIVPVGQEAARFGRLVDAISSRSQLETIPKIDISEAQVRFDVGRQIEACISVYSAVLNAPCNGRHAAHNSKFSMPQGSH